jgi:hypothetical protein
VNAHWVVIDGEIDRVPAEIFREFLAITGEGGFSTLQFIWDFSKRDELKLIPTDMLTRQLLTTSVPAREHTPIELAASNGNLDLIPWSSFVAVEWIPHLILLHKATALCEEHQYDENVWEHNGDGGLCAFIREVERMRRINQIQPLTIQ